MSENIPAEVMKVAENIAKEATRDAMRDPLMPYYITVSPHIARAILSAQAAQREKDARIAERTYAKDAFHFELGTAVAAAIRNQPHAPDPQAIAGTDLCPREPPASQSQEPTE